MPSLFFGLYHYCTDPPGPVSDLQVTTLTATTLTITWIVSGSIDQFEFTYNCTINRCLEMGEALTVTINAINMGTYIHTLDGLNEDSNYTMTVRAINIAGSTNVTITGETGTSSELNYMK